MTESRPLTLLHVFPGFAIGGAQMRFCDLANWNARQPGEPWRHLIVSLDGNQACAARLDPGVGVRFLDPGLIKGDTWRNLGRIRAALSAWRPDTLVTSNWGSIEWAMALAVPWPGAPRHIHTEDGFGPEERDRQLPRRVWTRRAVLRRSTVVLPSCTLLRIATDIWRLPPGRLRHIANGVDTARFETPEAAPAPWSLPTDGPVIGTIATLRTEKNLPRLLRAFRMVCDAAPARLVIVGDGPERESLTALAATLGLADRVAFPGYLAQPELAMRNFDLFALSSDTEQMPLSVLEAMAAGLAVAATDVGDVRDMLAPANARYVTARSDAALAAAILALVRAPADRAAIGASNRLKAGRDFNQIAMFAAYATLFAGRAA